MINSTELRLGNFVLVNGLPRQVTAITNRSVHTIAAAEANGQSPIEQELKNIDALPLTDDVLKEWGFVFHHYFKFWQLVTTGIRSEMDIDRDYNVIDFMRRPIMKQLTSLHQLQNIFFMLKGRDMKVHPLPVTTGGNT